MGLRQPGLARFGWERVFRKARFGRRSGSRSDTRQGHRKTRKNWKLPRFLSFVNGNGPGNRFLETSWQNSKTLDSPCRHCGRHLARLPVLFSLLTSHAQQQRASNVQPEPLGPCGGACRARSWLYYILTRFQELVLSSLPGVSWPFSWGQTGNVFPKVSCGKRFLRFV
jgi:hypothetical protein